MKALTRKQAMVPKDCTVIQNEAGTAPCTWFEREGRVLVSMPGVPSEMQWLMTHEVMPRLCAHFQRDTYIRHQSYWVSGFTESALALQLTDFERNLPDTVKLAYLPQMGIMRLRLTAHCANDTQNDIFFADLTEQLRRVLGRHLLAEEDRPLEMLLGDVLRAQRLTLGTAESCTGGAIASKITAVAGCSEYYNGTVVAYSNEVKQRVLGVSDSLIRQYGAVSREVVKAMAQGAMRTLSCDCAIATSGIAGPTGGTTDKPVGTVWIAVACGERVIAKEYHFSPIRAQNIQRATNAGLLMMWALLQEGDG